MRSQWGEQALAALGSESVHSLESTLEVVSAPNFFAPSRVSIWGVLQTK